MADKADREGVTLRCMVRNIMDQQRGEEWINSLIKIYQMERPL